MIASLEVAIRGKHKRIAELEVALTEKTRTITQLEEAVGRKNERIADLVDGNRKLTAEKARLREELDDLDRIMRGPF